MEIETQFMFLMQHVSRELRGQGTVVAAPVVPAWKAALWEANSVDPAMLRAPFLIIIFIFLWGFNVIIFEKSRVQYFKALGISQAPTYFTFMLAGTLLCVYAVTITVSSKLASYGVAISMAIFYAMLLLLLVAPYAPWAEDRSYWFKFIKQIVMPADKIAFREIVFADALCSMSKVFKDFGVTIVAFYAMYTGSSIVDYHDTAMIFIAVLASVPFWIRIRQCSVQFLGAPDNYTRFTVSLNILKYFSSFPPIWLAAYASLGYFHPKLPSYIAIMATINSLMSFAWDIVMDWGLISYNRPLGAFVCRKRNFFPSNMLMITAVVNFFLRFAWSANRLPVFQSMHPSHLILLIEAAEIFRRAVWNIFRVEWEVMVMEEREKLEESKIDEVELVSNETGERVGLLSPDA